MLAAVFFFFTPILAADNVISDIDEFVIFAKENRYENNNLIQEELRNWFSINHSKPLLRRIINNEELGYQIARTIPEALPPELEFFGYALCLEHAQFWDAIIAPNRNSFDFSIIIQQQFADSMLDAVPISAAVSHPGKRSEITKIFFEAQVELEKGEKTYEELKRETIKKIEASANDPEFLADPRSWKPAQNTSQKFSPAPIIGSKAEVTRTINAENFDSELKSKSEKSQPLSWLYWILGVVILGGLAKLILSSRR